MNCPRCGYNNEENCKFCAECGTSLETVVLRKAACPRCGAELEEGARFCSECGLSISGAELGDTPNEIPERKPVKEFKEKEPVKAPAEKKPSMALPIVLGVLASLLLAAVIGLAIWYVKLSKEADDYTVPDFEKIIEEEGEEAADADSSARITVTPTVTVTAAPTPTPTEEPKEHRYELVIEDCTWEEARQKCADKGGYLAALETEDEWDALIKTIELNGMKDKMFFIGARRELDGSTYYWADAQNQLTGESLNEDGSVLKSHWMSGEPSYQDQGIPEYCVNMYYYKDEGRWVLNDVPNNVLGAVKSYSGRIGYICEYEE